MLDPVDSYKTFNEFFYRKLKQGARPVAEPNNSKRAVSPADCRMNVFVTIDDATKVWIKGKHFSLKALLCDDNLAKAYDGGSIVICRLAPQDYHRFHVPVDGVLGELYPIDGTYYTVNPVAVREPTDVYTDNKRCRATIKTKDFGDVIYIAVGATLVGSIQFTRKTGDNIKRGEEMGYFAFGGSTVLLLFKKGSINLDEDLRINSSKALETLVAVGNSLGLAQ